MVNPVLALLRGYVAGTLPADAKAPVIFPPRIADTLGFKLTEVDEGTATMEIATSVERHGNPMGTIHGGVLCDIADAAIGTAHFTTLEAGESFTTVDLKINFFRPVWNTTLRATAHAVQRGRTIGYYECSITDENGKLVAMVHSTVMTLRGDAAKGR